MSERLTIELAPDWDEIDTLRERATAYFGEREVDPDATYAAVMAACELAENAVKYGHFGAEAPTIEVRLDCSAERLTVEVRSPLGEGGEEHLERLDEMIQWIRGFQDPHQAYLERLKEVAGQDLEHTESGLGLVRIAYEGRATLDFYVDETSTVAVSAVRERGAS